MTKRFHTLETRNDGYYFHAENYILFFKSSGDGTVYDVQLLPKFSDAMQFPAP